MDLGSITKAVLAVGTLAGTLVGLEGRQRRLRNHIRENLALVKELEANETLRELTGASSWLQGRIAVDVARLAGHNLGTRKKPIPWASLVMALVLGAALAFWTYWIVQDEFVWYAVFPGIASGLFFISVLGMLTDRQLPPDEGIPEGAVEIRSDSAQEQIASAVALAASGGLDDRWREEGQIGVVLQFIDAIQSGDFERALGFADDNFRLCRIQAWLWNNRDDIDEIEETATSMMERCEPEDIWNEFVAIETNAFVDAFSSIKMDEFGAASNRRRIGRDHDLVILAPTGSRGGYWVSRATAIPAALTFVVSRSGSGWRVAAPFATAPPLPGWPPTWWMADDPALEALPD